MHAPFRPALLGLALIGTLSADAFVSAANAQALDNVVLSSRENASESREIFATDTPKLYLSADITAAVKAGSKLEVSWVSIFSNGAAPPNYTIKELSFDVGMLDNRLKAQLSKPTAGWPVGSYQVRIAVDDETVESLDFEVK